MSEILLETDRLLLRHHEPQDLEPYCAMEADPDVVRYAGGRPRPRERAEERFRLGIEDTGRLKLWATIYKPEGRYIGRSGVYPHFDANSQPIPGEGALSLYLMPAYWGRGLATEAGQALLTMAFSELGLTRVIATVQEGNDASVRVMAKLGLRLVRTEVGEHRSYLHYEIGPTQVG